MIRSTSELLKLGCTHDCEDDSTEEERKAFLSEGWRRRLVEAFVLPLLLIIAVLGSIFKGYATPTEAAGVGAFGATLLTLSQG